MQDNITRTFEIDPDLRLKNIIGDPYEEYRKEWESVTRENFPTFPIHIDFELNDFCNQSCTMCPRNESFHSNITYSINTKTSLGFKTFAKVIDEGVDNGLKSINLGAFAEPLIHPKFLDFVHYARDRGVIDIRVITNGLLLDKFASKIPDSGITSLYVSLDAGTEKTYRKIRGHGYNKVVKSLKKMIDIRDRTVRGLPIIRVSYVDMEINKHEKEEFVNYWKDKVDFVDVQMLDNYDFSGDEEIHSSVPKKWDCMSPWARVAVLSDGTILPCCNFFGRNLPLGNVNSTSIKSVWESSEMHKTRERIIQGTSDNCELCQRV